MLSEAILNYRLSLSQINCIFLYPMASISLTLPSWAVRALCCCQDTESSHTINAKSTADINLDGKRHTPVTVLSCPWPVSGLQISSETVKKRLVKEIEQNSTHKVCRVFVKPVNLVVGQMSAISRVSACQE